MEKEMWNLYDKNLHITEHTYCREDGTENIPEGLYHLATWMYIFVRDGKLLLTQRHPNKKNPLKWEVPGCSILFGETPVQGAKREVVEEIGLVLEDQQVEVADVIPEKYWKLHDIYQARQWDLEYERAVKTEDDKGGS